MWKDSDLPPQVFGSFGLALFAFEAALAQAVGKTLAMERVSSEYVG